MRRKLVLVALVLGVCSFALIRSDAAVDPVKGDANEVHSFGPGVLVLGVAYKSIETQTGQASLKDAKLIKLGDRYFVTGKTVIAEPYKDKPEVSWQNGLETAVAWSDVTGYYVLTEKQLEESAAATKPEEE